MHTTLLPGAVNRTDLAPNRRMLRMPLKMRTVTRAGFEVSTRVRTHFDRRSDPSEIVTFVYGYGQGAVLYSTIPLDFYLDGASCVIGPAIRNTYTPNVVHYAAGLASDACGNGSSPIVGSCAAVMCYSKSMAESLPPFLCCLRSSSIIALMAWAIS